jgi:hypothetical protein
MAVEVTPFVPLAADTAAHTIGDALGAKASFSGIPKRGTIMSFKIIDRAEVLNAAIVDLFLFNADIVGTATNVVFAPTEAEMENSQGVLSMPTTGWFITDLVDLGLVDNIGLPYYAPEGELFFQCVTRGTPTLGNNDDVRVAIGIVY